MQSVCTTILLILFLGSTLRAADAPYFVTYSHRMEEPGNLEIAFQGTTASPGGGNRFLSGLLEIEYGVRAWWTSEVYFSGQNTFGESTLFTGYRWENRFRPLMREHWINPVLYVEYVDIDGADKSLKEIVGHDGMADQSEPSAISRLERKREIETKLILSSNFKSWNISENIIAEKNLANEPWEFGYAAAVSRPLALAASPRPCRLCPENFRLGIELYGGLGTRHEFGLNGNSYPALFRFSLAFEINQFGRGGAR